MASNIWEALQKSQGAPIPPGGYTNQLNQLIQAKTGKAPTEGTGPGKTNLAEQQATLMGQAEANRTSNQIQVAQQGFQQELTGMQQQASQQLQSISQSYNEKQQQMRQQADKLYAETSNQFASMDAQRKVNAFEQLGFLYSMSNDDYLFNLQKEGTKRRLDNELQFNEALQMSMYEDQVDLLKTDIKFKRMIDLQNDSAVREIANMDINTAVAVFSEQQQAGVTSRVYSGMAQATSALLPAASDALTPKKPQSFVYDAGLSPWNPDLPQTPGTGVLAPEYQGRK